MKTALATLLLSGQAVSSAVSLRHATRQSSQGCSFHLDSAGTVSEDVEEDHTGKLHLAGSFQQGGFTLDGGKVHDALGNQCFMRGPKYQFQCYQSGVIGNTTFTVEATTNNGTLKLVYDDGPGTYLACSADGSTYEIYSTSKPDTTGCLEVSLVLSETNGECTVSDSTVSSPNSTSQQNACARRAVRRNPQTVSVDVEPSEPSSTCSVSPSAPSLTPTRIGSPDTESPDGMRDTGVNASITATNSTIFRFSIPRSYTTSGYQLCALQFRFPVCGNLPQDYPCFKFTGSEQEMLSDSGMVFAQFGNDTQLPTWNNTALQQIYPGDNKTLGTFECGNRAYGNDTRNVAWLASSVRNFGLQYEQAGVASSKFEDGVGAFIVQCL